MKYSTIHDLPSDERPRERLVRLGPEALSIQELLAILLQGGMKGKSVMALSQELINEFGNHKNIANASVAELLKISGIGTAKAVQLKAAFELGKRVANYQEEKNLGIVKNAGDVFNILQSRLKGKKKEHFYALSLNTRNHVNQVISVEAVSMGSLDSSIVHPREAFKDAISSHAASIIFVHNHPSGITEPSEDDIKLTKRLKEAGELLGIEVLDHIIMCDNGYLSMKAANLI